MQLQKRQNQTNNQTNRKEGIISISSRGTGYVAVGIEKNKGQDPEIDFRHLNTALHGDMVEIILHPKEKGRTTAEVSKIISRAKIGFTGILEIDNKLFFLKPDDTKMYTDILIPKESLNNAEVGQKVFAEIVSWKDPRKAPEGKVIKILGKPGDNNTEMHAIAIEKGFNIELPQEVEEEAKKIKQNGIKGVDYEGRKDFRKILTFTIDPSDAKDFDDAISFRELADNEYEVGIHIADVTHYVKIGSVLDEEARERGTSVYLVDRTIPMLPEILSNDLCSLVPHKDRLTMSAVFVIDKNAKIKSEYYGQTIIHSQKRFTYEEAEESIKIASSAIRRKGGNLNNPFQEALFILNNLAKKLNKERFDLGAISLDQEEVKFILDKNGTPIKVIKKERGDSNRLIEEFMLLANKKVAKVLSKNISIYRVHDLPSKEKMTDLAFFLRSLGYKISLQNGIIPTHQINKLLESLVGKNEKDTVERVIIKSMAKAIYSTKNIGHYGLAFQYYTHFTSPIRRYPDIVIHRLLKDYLANKSPQRRSAEEAEKLKKKLSEYEKIARISSEQEKRASDAERASIKYKQVEYMSKHLGKIFNGIISGITEWGMYVEEIETKCEGLVRMRDMKDDFYIFNEKKLELFGQKKKKKYRLGSRVKIKVQKVDLERKTIDYVLI
ncbi:MAG: ribonuclease R [Candidatus Paceibacterota bacterium]